MKTRLFCPERFILASASPRRRELLKLLGIDFDVVAADVDENISRADDPKEAVRMLALKKAKAVAAQSMSAWALGADTTVVLDNEIFGKPADRDEAVMMLEKLSGQTHFVHTGFAIVNGSKKVETAEAVSSAVTFRPLSKAEIFWYAGSDEPYDKAGAYALQGLGAAFITGIVGSYTNIIGLPLSEVVGALLELGVIKLIEEQSR